MGDTQGLAALLQPCVRGRQVAIVTNATVGGLYGDAVVGALKSSNDGVQIDLHEIGDGEAFKNFDTYSKAMDWLLGHGHNRTSCLIALGGGVVGDLAGFVAATYQRGIDFVQIPTTLLAQVDSSVGGKTAINHRLGKNMIGAFYQPRAVVIDTAVLNTLPPREYAAGLSEVVKYGVIADAAFYDWLERNVEGLVNKEPSVLSRAIQRSCEIKARVVAQDEREGGLRAILNYGHTFGHAIENLSGYGTWLHGEAIAVGMLMAHRFSERLSRLDQGSEQRLQALLTALGLPVALESGVTAEGLKQAMGLDKKAVDGRIRFVVANSIGDVELVDEYDEGVLSAVLEEFC